jgi:hypothetical protein
MLPDSRARAHSPGRFLLTLLIGAGALAALGCNAAVGGGVVALAGGAGILAAQCYDQVRIRVRDDRGVRMCDANVSITSDGSERTLRPCYHASLTEGRYLVRAQQAGYVPVETQIDIPERTGSCPHYTRTVEFTLRRPGQRPAVPSFKPASPAAPSPAPGPTAPATDAPAGPPTAEFPIVPAPLPATPPAPAAPPAPAPPPTPAPPAPAPPPIPAPAPPPTPAPPPALAPVPPHAP